MIPFVQIPELPRFKLQNVNPAYSGSMTVVVRKVYMNVYDNRKVYM